MADSLGRGELVSHYRRYVEDDDGRPVRQPIECGVSHGCVTAVIEDVHCRACKTVAERADRIADQCGCRRGHVHRNVAQIQIEKEDAP